MYQRQARQRHRVFQRLQSEMRILPKQRDKYKNKDTAVSSDKLIEIFEKLIAEGAENINLVNPTHYAVQLKELFEK